MTEIDNIITTDAKNIHNELLLVGSLYKSPDLYVEYSDLIRSKYDFADECTKFMYDNFVLMYKTFSQTVNQSIVNTFMSQYDDRLRQYSECGGWEIIQNWMSLANTDDFNHYYDTVKKFSLVREYERRGFPVSKIMAHPDFHSLNAADIYWLIRSQADRIHTVILNNKDSVILNEESNERLFSNILQHRSKHSRRFFIAIPQQSISGVKSASRRKQCFRSRRYRSMQYHDKYVR